MPLEFSTCMHDSVCRHTVHFIHMIWFFFSVSTKSITKKQRNINATYKIHFLTWLIARVHWLLEIKQFCFGFMNFWRANGWFIIVHSWLRTVEQVFERIGLSFKQRRSSAIDAHASHTEKNAISLIWFIFSKVKLW